MKGIRGLIINKSVKHTFYANIAAPFKGKDIESPVLLPFSHKSYILTPTKGLNFFNTIHGNTYEGFIEIYTIKKLTFKLAGFDTLLTFGFLNLTFFVYFQHVIYKIISEKTINNDYVKYTAVLQQNIDLSIDLNNIKEFN